MVRVQSARVAKVAEKGAFSLMAAGIERDLID